MPLTIPKTGLLSGLLQTVIAYVPEKYLPKWAKAILTTAAQQVPYQRGHGPGF